MEQTPATGGMLQLVLLCLFLILFLVPAILFLLTQQNLLRSIKPENRLLQPGLVWLQIIPLFGMVWQFFVITRLAGSIQKELLSGGEDSILGFSDASAVEAARKKPTQTPGLLYASTFTLAGLMAIMINLFSTVAAPPTFTLILGLIELVGFIFWIVYWVSIADYRRKLKNGMLLAGA